MKSNNNVKKQNETQVKVEQTERWVVDAVTGLCMPYGEWLELQKSRREW
jgi:hypothetical protein